LSHRTAFGKSCALAAPAAANAAARRKKHIIRFNRCVFSASPQQQAKINRRDQQEAWPRARTPPACGGKK
jgi:hypothetical protein